MEIEADGAAHVLHPDVHPDTYQESPKAWMSVRDAELCERLLTTAARLVEPLRVLEWGSGRSTISFLTALEDCATSVSWLTLEYDRSFWHTQVAPRLTARDHVVVDADRTGNVEASLRCAPGLAAALYDRGPLFPFKAGHEEDRDADLDQYVALPGRVHSSYDIIIVDGRKRRRCLLEAARLVKPTGFVLLHDAQRTPYHCAFTAFRSHRRFGDKLWIGAQRETAFTTLLPASALFPSRSDGPHAPPVIAGRQAAGRPQEEM